MKIIFDSEQEKKDFLEASKIIHDHIVYIDENGVYWDEESEPLTEGLYSFDSDHPE